jgi:protein ImuB
MVGEGNAGTPELLNTHRPDAFQLKKPGTVHSFPDFAQMKSGNEDIVPVFAVRVFRPVLPASVRLRAETPHYVAAPGVRGEVSEAAGPWRTSGEWWTRTRWARDEWDVELERNGLYRIYFDLDAREWFVEGVYD